jgi:hypothetical protein
VLFNPATRQWTDFQVYFDGTLTAADPQLKTYQDEFWTVFYKRAFDQLLKQVPPPTVLVAFSLEALTGKVPTSVHQPFAGLQQLKTAVASGNPIVYGVIVSHSDHMIGEHAFAVIGVRPDDKIEVYNPQGIDGRGVVASGWANDGIIYITWAEFAASGFRHWIGKT